MCPFDRPALGSWPEGITPAQAMELQRRLRRRLVVGVPPGFRAELVAGADVSIARGRDVGFGAIVVLNARDMRTVAQATASVPVAFPYIPGLLSFRELPPLAVAWSRLSVLPDVLIFDAHGIAHPRGFGLACHGGMLFDIPSIGAAKSILVGEHSDLAEARGASVPLLHEGVEVGRVLRTRTGVSPIYVSVGHRMDLATAVDVVLSVSPVYRLPEPVRRAHGLSLRAHAEGR